jgi:hypothetical protein
MSQKLGSAEFLEGLGVSWQADDSGFSLILRKLPGFPVTRSITRETVVDGLRRLQCGEVEPRETRLWASLLLMLDCFEVDANASQELRDQLVDALHFLASFSEADPALAWELESRTARLLTTGTGC